MKKIDKKHLLGVLLVMILTAGISLEIGRVLPTIGALDTPANGTVSDYYIDHAAHETASPNLVTAVLADYRGFDTLFETCVLFLSGVVVCLTLLEGKEGKNEVSAVAERKNLRQERKSAFDLAFRAVIPVLVIYAVYVLLHGEVSLGGGFQAGALLACAYLLDRISPGRSMYLPRLRTEATLLLGGLGTFFFALTGALCMILAGLLPPVGNFFASLPESVLGGCTIMMFGSILTSGVQMIAECGFSQRNITIVSLSLAVGIGFTTASESGIWNIFPSLVQSVFAENVVAVVFVISIILSLVLPENMEIKKLGE